MTLNKRIDLRVLSEFENCKKASEVLIKVKEQGKLEGTFKRIRVTSLNSTMFSDSITLHYNNNLEQMLAVIKKHNIEHGVID